MSVLWTAAEIEEFETRDANMTNSTYIKRTGYSRGSFYADVYLASCHHNLGADYTDLWLSVRVGRSAWTNTYRVLGLTHGVGSSAVKIALTGGSGQYLRIVSYNGSTQTTLATSTSPMPESFSSPAPVKIDLQVIDLDTSSCTINVYVDGTLFVTYTGDLSAICTHVDGVWFGTSAADAYYTYFSEVIVADESTIRMSLVTLQPASDDTNTFDGGTYASVDELVENFGGTLYSGTAGQIFLATANDTPSGVLSVRNVKVHARAARGSSGPSKLDLGIKSGSTTDWGPDNTLTEGYTSVTKEWTTNPATSLPFTDDEVDSLKIGAKSIT